MRDEHRERYRTNPLRVLDCKRPAVPRRDRGRAPHHRLPRRGVCGTPGPGAGRPRRARHRVPPRAPARARARLLHPHHLRILGRVRSPRPRTPSAAAAATTDWPRPSGAHPPRASASASASSACCWRATPRGCSRWTPRLPDAFVVDVTGGAAARALCGELRRAGLGVVRAYDGRSLKAQLKQADRSGARVRAHRGSRGAGRQRRDGEATAGRGPAGDRAPCVGAPVVGGAFVVHRDRALERDRALARQRDTKVMRGER